MSNISIWSIYRALSGATTPGQSGPGCDDNEGVFHIPQSSRIYGASPSHCLVSNPRHLLEGSYPSAEMQSVYSTAPANWAIYACVNSELLNPLDFALNIAAVVPAYIFQPTI